MVDQRIYLPGSELWRAQQAEAARSAAEVAAAWDDAHNEYVMRREESRLAKLAATAPTRHFTVLVWPASQGDLVELLLGARCPVCRRSWTRSPGDFVPQNFETTVSAGEVVSGTVDVRCRACEHVSEVSVALL